MRPYLIDYFQTLSGRRQERAGDLLRESKVGKEQLSVLRERLENTIAQGNALALRTHTPETLIRANSVTSNVMSIRERIEELYDVSNSIAVMLSSHSALLASDVKALEDELLEMEKMIFNFSFLLSDNQAYDYAFLEPFNDEQGRDTSVDSIPDRSNLGFGPGDEAAIRKSEGNLVLPDSSLIGHGITPSILKGNATSFTIADTGINNVVKTGISAGGGGGRGWKQTMLTAGPITASLPEAKGRTGAQVVLELQLTEPSPCSEIRLVPYADTPLELVQITTFESEDSSGNDQMEGVRRLDRPYTLHFPTESVAKFHVVLNQPTYHRVTKHEDVLEFQYHNILEGITHGNQGTYKRIYFVSSIEEAVLLEAMGRGNQSISLPSTDVDPSGPIDAASLSLAFRFDRQALWSEGSGDNTFILFDVLQKSEDNEVNDIRRYNGDFDVTRNTRILATDNPISQHVEKAINTQVVGSGFTYYYNLGLHNVRIGIETPGFKGVFLSKALPAPGDIGEVRLKTSETNYFASNSSRQSTQLTSVEHSVSRKSNPVYEVDWKPILPVGTSQVRAERIFLDAMGRGTLRFPANSGLDITVYRNGYAMSFGSGSVEPLSNAPGIISGVAIDLVAVSAEDIFTCDYYPANDQTVVSFEDDDYNVPALVFAHDETGAGERYMSTTDRNIVTLQSRPYIDVNQLGTGYEPIIVQLENGIIATNMTDYEHGNTQPMPAPDENGGYYYIHSGNTLMFNQSVRRPFRVFYQYLQNNVRFRTVLRCNVRGFVSPQVDYVHLKAKTRNPDVRSI